MYRVGFTGTRAAPTTAQQGALGDTLYELHTGGTIGIELHHGDCVGADAAAHAYAAELGIPVVIHPPKNTSKRSMCGGKHVVAWRPPLDYLDRNQNIVNEADMLVACPYRRDEQLRSGTWATIRRARKKGIPIMLIYPDGSVALESSLTDASAE